MPINNIIKTDIVCAVERIIRLYINGEYTQSFACSPYNIKDLIIGNLYVTGQIESYQEVKTITVDKTKWMVRVELNKTPTPPTDIGNIQVMIDRRNRSETTGYRTSVNKLRELCHYMEENSQIGKKTGGVHMALLSSGDTHVLREDIGRHNAIDKVIGSFLRSGLDVTASSLVITGRFSADMLYKIISAGIPVAGSLKFPSDLGYNMAIDNHICLVGKLLKESPQIYCGSELLEH